VSFSVLGGAIRVSGHPFATRAWLKEAASAGLRQSATWANGALNRRNVVLLMTGAVLIGGVAGTRDAQTRTADMSPAARAIEISMGSGSVNPRAGAFPSTSTATSMAQAAKPALDRPSYALSSAAVQALSDVQLTIADSSHLQELRTEIMAPAQQGGLSGTALDDLISLVRQAQVSPSLAGESHGNAIDPIQLAQAQTAVKAAQQRVIAATKARDAALTGGLLSGDLPSSLAGASGTTSASPTAAAIAAAAVEIPGLRDAQARFDAAQVTLTALLTVPSPDQINQARAAITDAIAKASTGPTDAQMAAAKSAVDNAQSAYDAIGASSAQATTNSVPSRAAVPSNSGVRTGQTIALPDPAAKPADAAARNSPAIDSQQVADAQANLDSAKAALADLQRKAATATNPEAQPSVIAARKRLADLTAPPDPTAVANAQAQVASAQGALNALLATRAPTMASTAATSSGQPGSHPQVAGSAVAPATASNGGGGDPVADAEQGLTDAQNALHDLVAGSNGVSTADAANSAGLPSGSTVTQLPPGLSVAATPNITFGASVSANDLSAVEVGLRARYVLSSALMSAHLHPSALPATGAGLQQSGALASRSFTWPVVGAITQPFGVPELGVGLPHTGLDIGVGVATPVLASASGVVTFAGGDPTTGYGYYAIIDHGGGVSTLYAHLALPPFLHTGQLLAQGGLIGLSGSTGFSTGPHVHFEVRLNGVPVDPQRVLPAISAR
jgi:murein DD-endopeptidase MepM/ murein hydrolase activator NlpD